MNPERIEELARATVKQIRPRGNGQAGAAEPQSAKHEAPPAEIAPADVPEETEELRPPGFSDDALADRFVTCHGEDLRYVAQWGQWLEWDGRRWRQDRTVHVFDMVRKTCRLAAQGAEKDSLARAVASAAAVAAAERLARADRRVAALPEDFDADDYLLNTPAGIVDLRTGTMRPARRDDLLTKVTGVSPDANMPCPMFSKFLEQITRGDEELAEYLRRVAGYCLSGDTREHAIFFAHGTGANGKSTLLDVLQFAYGDYAKTIPAETLLEARGGRHPTEIANLMGVRLALSSELEEGQWWAEARVKSLTGDEHLSARFMRQDFFTFRKTHKHLIAGNHRPALRTVDTAMRRRMHLLPFEAQFTGEACDRDMPRKLKAEAPAILAWAIQGCLEWQAGGLQPPQCAMVATADYLDSMDTLRQWIAGCCVTGDALEREASSTLYASYAAWKSARGEGVPSQTRFSEALQGAGYQKRKVHGRPMFAAIVLTAQARAAAEKQP